MAVGDDAVASGMPLVPDSGEEGKIKWGSREINRTRDFIAQVKKMIPIGVDGYRASVKINYGFFDPGPNDGVDGEIFFRVL